MTAAPSKSLRPTPVTIHPIEALGAFVAGLGFQDLPGAIVEKARVILLHNLAMALAAGKAGRLAGEYLRLAAVSDPAGATALSTGCRVALQDAVLANGVLFHARAQDDVQHGAGSHLGAIVLPAALAVAESSDASGAELLAAIVAGYETASVIGREFSKLSTRRGFRSSGIYGVFGSAAAAARLFRLDARATSQALAHAANFAAGLNQTWITGTPEFRVQTAFASRNGVLAALLARAGAEAAPDVLEGAAGFYRAYTGETQDIADRLVTLGVEWSLPDVSFKPYPVCGINQVPVHLMLATLAANPFDAVDVQSIRVALTTYEARYPGINARGPFRDVGATLMSTQFCLASAVRRRAVSLADLSRFEDRDVMDIVQRIEVVEDPALPPYGCRLTVSLRSGRRIDAENLAGAENFKFTWDRAVDVARALRPEMHVSDDQFERLLGLLRRVERLDDVRALVGACVDASSSAHTRHG